MQRVVLVWSLTVLLWCQNVNSGAAPAQARWGGALTLALALPLSANAFHSDRVREKGPTYPCYECVLCKTLTDEDVRNCSLKNDTLRYCYKAIFVFGVIKRDCGRCEDLSVTTRSFQRSCVTCEGDHCNGAGAAAARRLLLAAAAARRLLLTAAAAAAAAARRLLLAAAAAAAAPLALAATRPLP